jgi:hypothetical protein
MISLLSHFAYALLARYFVPLAIGLLLLLVARPFGRNARKSGWFPLVLVGLGILGSVEGLPLLMREISQLRAERAHFESRCKSAEVVLPERPLAATESSGATRRLPDGAI